MLFRGKKGKKGKKRDSLVIRLFPGEINTLTWIFIITDNNGLFSCISHYTGRKLNSAINFLSRLRSYGV